MAVLILIALGSVLGGALLGVAGRRSAFSALNTFALVSALAVVLAQLLPDALAGAGLAALVVFAVGALGPTLLERLGRRIGTRGAWGLELGYWALFVHQLADGVGLATYGAGRHAGHDHVAVLVAIAAHTVPIIALVTLVYHRRGGPKAVVLRIAPLAGAVIVGLFLPGLLPSEGVERAEPWVTALVAGLLAHVVAHDWQPEHEPPRARSGRFADMLAIALGIGLVVLGGGEHHHGEAGATDLRADVGHALLELSLETAPALLIGLAIGAALSAMSQRLPTEWLRRGGALSQALRGAVVGAPLPICACGVLPLAESLRRRGAGAALVVSFLIATPELGVETFALTGRLLGWPFAIVRVVAAVILAIVAALVVSRFAPRPSGTLEDEAAARPHDGRPFLARFAEGFDELLYHVAPWTVVGLVGAAYVQASLPTEALGSLRSYGADVAVITLVSIPSYVCAASATPLAAVLLAKGMSPGAVLVGLLIGPATNLATLGFLRKAFGTRAAAIALAAVVACAWGMAGLINMSSVPVSTAPAGAEAEHTHGTLSLVIGVVLVLALLRSIWLNGLRAWLGSLAEGFGGHPDGHAHHGHAHGHAHGHGHGHDHAHDHGDGHDHAHDHGDGHEHEHAHARDHDHAHDDPDERAHTDSQHPNRPHDPDPERGHPPGAGAVEPT
ncbi:MAG: permease [Sandaracinaceae bacterium]